MNKLSLLLMFVASLILSVSFVIIILGYFALPLNY